MSDREQDKRVAEILGMHHEIAMSQNAMLTYELPRFTADPAADYKVLEWVRSRRGIAGSLLRGEYGYQLGSRMLAEYHPGDYSRALLMLDEQGLLK